MIDRDFLCGKYCYITYVNISSNQEFEFEVSYDSLDDFVKLANSGFCDLESSDNLVTLYIYN